MGRTGPIVVIGVAGSGKTTIGRLLAERLSTSYAEADDHHPPGNVEKMARGIPLTDNDRAPWLAAIARRIAAAGATGGLVVSCSALKRSYRDILRNADPQILFVHLLIDQARAADRVAVREGHFMPVSLVASQFAALEPLQADERAVCVSATQTPERIVAAVLGQLPVVSLNNNGTTSGVSEPAQAELPPLVSGRVSGIERLATRSPAEPGPGRRRPVIVVKGVANPACPAAGPGPFLLQSRV